MDRNNENIFLATAMNFLLVSCNRIQFNILASRTGRF